MSKFFKIHFKGVVLELLAPICKRERSGIHSCGFFPPEASLPGLENLRIVDNFYQTSLFFPMPTVVISTLCEDGSTTLGPYSLVQPYYVAGKDFYAMLLSCRNSSNTAQNILRNGKWMTSPRPLPSA